MTDTPGILELAGIEQRFGSLEVLRGVDLSIRRGDTTVIIGPSGCGKSVLLKTMMVLLRPKAGRVLFNGRDITELSERDLAPVRRRMGMVFQGGALFDSMTVQQNICFPLAEDGGFSEDEQAQRCQRALQRVGLDGIQQKMPQELSGGQKKRVALARAVVLDPEVIFYDEPTTGLDPVRADLINELIRKLQRETQATSVVVTHDMASAEKIGDRILMLWEGRFIADAAPSDLRGIENDVVRRFVEGRASEEELQQLQQG